MAEKTIKIQIINGTKQENFYMKFYLDMIYPCFDKFKSKLMERCAELDHGSIVFSMYWIDEDNDEIIIKNDDDLRFYGEQVAATKVVVRVQKPDNPEPTTPQKDEELEFIPTTTASPVNESNKSEIHYGIICDGCDGTITGFRYKCMQCADFDLCMKCESQMTHSNHLMIRISNENMKNLSTKRMGKINMRHFAPACAPIDVEMFATLTPPSNGERPATAVALSSEEDKEKKNGRHRKGEPNGDEKCKQKRYHRSQSKQEAKDKKQEEKTKRHQERALRSRQKLDRYGRMNIPHFLSYMMDPANLGTHDVPTVSGNQETTNGSTQQSQPPNPEQPSSKSFRAAASANLPGNMGGAAASAHIGCPFSFTSQPLQHIQQINRTLSNFFNPFGMNVEFGFPNTATTTTTTTSSATAATATGNGETQTETRTDESSSQTQQQQQEEKLTQTESKQTTTSTSTSSSKVSFSSIGDLAAASAPDADIPAFVAQNRELFAKIAASAAAGAAESAYSALQSAELAASFASSTAPTVIENQSSTPVEIPEPFLEDCVENSPTESINDDWTYVYQQVLNGIDQIQPSTGAIPKVTATNKSPTESENQKNSSVDFIKLSNDLRKHIEEQLCQNFNTLDTSADAEKEVVGAEMEVGGAEKDVAGAEKEVAGAEKPMDVEDNAVPTPITLPTTTAIPMPAPKLSASSIPLRQHEKIHIDTAIRTMMTMGFNNDGGWLTRLLETVDGNIPRALEFLQPYK